MSELHEAYSRLKATAGDLVGPHLRHALLELMGISFKLIAARGEIVPLESSVIDKEYYMFQDSETSKTSRPVNAGLFSDTYINVPERLAAFLGEGCDPTTVENLNSLLYTSAMSYCIAADLTKSGDKKTPGTFFEIFVGHLVGSTFGVSPTKTITVPTLELVTTLPTDFIFDLGRGKPRIHMPVKTSTRERVIQVWAHQRVLDGMHGVNRFRGVLVALTETNKQRETSVVEVCLPGQWAAYQMYIARMHRVYYFDPPLKYLELRNSYPFIQVKPFAHFFEEHEELVTNDESA